MSAHLRRTKILATLGPATDPPGVLDALLRAGVDVVRLNFSHGDPSAQVARAQAVREAAQRVGVEVGILADLPGPKIRIETFAERHACGCKAGDRFDLVAAPMRRPATSAQVGVSYLGLPDDVRARRRAAARRRPGAAAGRLRSRASASSPPCSTTARCPTARA